MESIDLDQLRYPLGKFSAPDTYTSEIRATNINRITSLPQELRVATDNMSEAQLNLPYRIDGWSTRQIVHHLADSHMNSLIRFKLALTEDNPTIKPYDQDAWATVEDAKMPIDVSLAILDGVHARLSQVMDSMDESDFQKTLYHPEWKKNLSLDLMGSLYGWHGHHHLTQITELKKRNNWS